MVRDPVSDMLTRIKNAQAVRKSAVQVPYSSLIYNILKVLEQEKVLGSVTRKGKRIRRTVEAELLYNGDEGRIRDARRVSKLSRRVYKRASEIFPVKKGSGMAVISTSKGVMTDKEARKARLGGEVLFELW